MDNNLVLQTLILARNQIQSLQRQNELFRAKVDTLEVFAAALGIRPKMGYMSPDPLFELDERIKEFSAPITEDDAKFESV